MGCSSSAVAQPNTEAQLRIPHVIHDGIAPQCLNFEAKIVLLGDSGVGKSSLALRFCRGRFPQYHEVTIGAAFLQQTVRVDKAGNQLKLYIWDTGGQERFRAMAPLYYRDAAGAVVVYDITSPSTVDAVAFWVKELQQRGPPHCRISVAANKSDEDTAAAAEEDDEEREETGGGGVRDDLQQRGGRRRKRLQQQQSRSSRSSLDGSDAPPSDANAPDSAAQRKLEMQRYCEAEGMTFVECSAKTGYNVNFLFEDLAKQIFEQLKRSGGTEI